MQDNRTTLSEADIEKLAVEHEAFGFGLVDDKGYTTHGFDPDGLCGFAAALLKLAADRRPTTEQDSEVGPSDDLRDALTHLHWLTIGGEFSHWIETEQPEMVWAAAKEFNAARQFCKEANKRCTALRTQPQAAPDVCHVRFLGVDPLDPVRGAVMPMIPDSWRFGFHSKGDGSGMTFGLADNGPYVAYEAVRGLATAQPQAAEPAKACATDDMRRAAEMEFAYSGRHIRPEEAAVLATPAAPTEPT